MTASTASLELEFRKEASEAKRSALLPSSWQNPN